MTPTRISRASTRLIKRCIAVAALLTVTALGLASPASATFGSVPCSIYMNVRQCVFLQPNMNVKYGFEGTVGNQIPGFSNAYDWAAANVYNATDLLYFRDLTGSKQNAHVYVTDFNFNDNGYYAWTECLPGSLTGGLGTNRWCYPQKLRFNSYYSAAYSTTAKKRAEACHETGHAVGLRHPVAPNTTNTCMHTGMNSTTHLSAAEKSQINSHY